MTKKFIAMTLAISACFSALTSMNVSAEAAPVLGDANNDGIFTISDAVVLQKWLLGSDVSINAKNADLCKDGMLNVYDFVMMRKELTKITEVDEPTAENPVRTYEGMTAYEAFIAENDIPVKYEDVAEFGEFKLLTVQGVDKDGVIAEYSYELINESGSVVCLTISKEGYRVYKPENALSEEDVQLADMRKTIDPKASGIYTSSENGKTYRYREGRLINISWLDNGYEYILSSEPTLSEFPVYGDMTVTKLLILKEENKTVFKDYSEYKNFIYDNGLEDDLVEYVDIDNYGKFSSFEILGESSDGEIMEYAYNLVDDADFPLTLTITKNGYKFYGPMKDLKEDEVNFSDMRYALSPDAIGGYTCLTTHRSYQYRNGKLNIIEWYGEDCYYTLSSEKMLCNYPIDAETVVAGMLKIE